MNLIRLFRPPLFRRDGQVWVDVANGVSGGAPRHRHRHATGGACAQAFDLRARPIDLGASLDPLRAGRKLRSARCKASNREGTGPRTQGFDRCAQASDLRPQHPHSCAQGSDPRRGKDARLARKGSRFVCKTGGVARKGSGVARKAEEACAWGFEGCARCCVRTPTGSAAWSVAFQTRRLGQEAWWAAFQAQRAEVIYRSAGDEPIELGTESAQEPGRTWK